MTDERKRERRKQGKARIYKHDKLINKYLNVGY
jgi:hypothetical protein